MKKNPAAIFAAVACLLSALCLYWVSSLQRNLDQNIGNLSSAIYDQIGNISSSVYSALEQEASLLADSRWEYGRLDLETRTVPLYLFITPKTVTPGVTTATIFGKGDPIPLALTDGVFGATVRLDLFAQEELTRVVFTEGDTQKTQALHWYLSPQTEFLPVFHSSIFATCKPKGKDTVALEISSVSLNNIYKPRFSPTLLSAQLVEYWGEEEKGRHPLLDKEALSGRMIRLDRPLDLTLTYPQDQDYKLYLEITDEWGFHYQTPVHSNRSDNDYPGDRILDDDGNVLYAEKTW